MCNNKDQKYFSIKNGNIYCRKCILLNRLERAYDKTYFKNNYKAKINYALSKTQQKASAMILDYVSNNKSVIVNAVCGAGKTELVYESIEHFINKGLKVAFAIPRKDVVIEIYNRLKKDYPDVEITSVYGGHSNDIFGQIIVLTTHQLFRYNKYFDLLILDEADAFPYYNDKMLSYFLKRSVKGPIVYMSATIKDAYKKECKNIVYVNRRYHNYDLPVPKYIKYNVVNKIEILKFILNVEKYKQVIIFVPTIDIGNYLSKLLNIHFVYSSFPLKQKYIDLFKSGKIRRLISTSILERGITLKNVQVIVYEATHKYYDEATLIQIAGRVGRKKDAPTGNVYFLSKYQTGEMKKCINQIKLKNKAIV